MRNDWGDRPGSRGAIRHRSREELEAFGLQPGAVQAGDATAPGPADERSPTAHQRLERPPRPFGVLGKGLDECERTARLVQAQLPLQAEASDPPHGRALECRVSPAAHQDADGEGVVQLDARQVGRLGVNEGEVPDLQRPAEPSVRRATRLCLKGLRRRPWGD